MGILSALGAVFLFTLACNLDTVLLAMGYALKGIHVTAGQSVLVAAVTTAVTLLSLLLGDAAAALLPVGAGMLGGVALVALGLCFLLDGLRVKMEVAGAAAPRQLWGWVSLAAALAVNNAGIGMAAGVTGIGPLEAALCNFLVTLAALPVGRWLGRRAAGRLLGRAAVPLSGALLVVLGVWEIVI